MYNSSSAETETFLFLPCRWLPKKKHWRKVLKANSPKLKLKSNPRTKKKHPSCTASRVRFTMLLELHDALFPERQAKEALLNSSRATFRCLNTGKSTIKSRIGAPLYVFSRRNVVVKDDPPWLVGKNTVFYGTTLVKIPWFNGAKIRENTLFFYSNILQLAGWNKGSNESWFLHFLSNTKHIKLWKKQKKTPWIANTRSRF